MNLPLKTKEFGSKIERSVYHNEVLEDRLRAKKAAANVSYLKNIKCLYQTLVARFYFIEPGHGLAIP